MDRDLDLSLLRTFLTIATTGSFTAAGQRLFRTQPAISLRLKRLEDTIGFPLIKRSADGIVLTREGTLLFHYAKRMLALNDELVGRIWKVGAGEVIRIGLAEEYAALDLERVLKAFAIDSPTVSVGLDVRTSRALNDGFREGRLDMMVNVDLPTAAEGRPIRRTPVVWVSGEQTTLSRYGEIRLVLPPEGNLYRALVLQALGKTETPWDIACTASNWASTKSAVLAGLGISAVSADMMVPGLRPAETAYGLPPLPDIGVFLACRSRIASESEKRLTELLVDSLTAAAPGHPLGEAGGFEAAG